MRSMSDSMLGSGSSLDSCTRTQRDDVTTKTSEAPASRCRKESLPGLSTSKRGWAYFVVETVSPVLLRIGRTSTTRLVSPLPLQPTMPMTFMPTFFVCL